MSLNRTFALGTKKQFSRKYQLPIKIKNDRWKGTKGCGLKQTRSAKTAVYLKLQNSRNK